MKKIFFFIIILGMCAFMLGAQDSFLYWNSFGLFRNELDAAMNVSEATQDPVFSKLDMFYLFGGLTNWYGLDTVEFDNSAFTLGLYKPGSMPFSIYSSFMNVTTETGLYDDTTLTTATEPVVDGTTTTNYTWTTQSDTTVYAFFETTDLDLTAQYLTRFAGINMGIIVDLVYENNVSGALLATWAGNNVTTTNNYYYNTAGAGEVPEPELDYTRTITESMPDTEMDMDFTLPMYMELGTMGLFAQLHTGFDKRDQSVDNSTEYTNPESVILFNNVVFEDSVEDKNTDLSIDVDTTLSMAPLFAKGNPDNRFDVSLNGGILFGMPSDLIDTTIQKDLDFPGGGGDYSVVGAGPDTTITETRKGKTFWDVYLSGQHFFYFDKVTSLRFALAPIIAARTQLSLADPSDPNYYTTEIVTISMVDNDPDGEYTSDLDTITTTTQTFTNDDDNGTILRVGAEIALPFAVEWKMEKAPFSFVFANRIMCSYNIDFYTDKTLLTNTEEVVEDGTGTVTSTTVDTEEEETEETWTLTEWDFSNEFRFCLLFNLPADITLTVELNGTDLFDFTDLAAEIIIPVPSAGSRTDTVEPEE